MSRHQRPFQQGTQLPSTMQVAKLHAHLNETKNLAHKLNLPITAVIWNMIFYAMRAALDHDWLLPTLQQLIDDYSPFEDRQIGALALCLPMMGMLGFAYYQLWQAIANRVDALLPNGVGFSLTKHKAYDASVRFGSGHKVNEHISDLQTLNARQRERLKINAWPMYILSFAVPVLGACHYTAPGRFSFSLGSISLNGLFPHIAINLPQGSWVPSELRNILGQLQGIQNLEWLGNKWSNRNIGEQFNAHAKKLAHISNVFVPWTVNTTAAKTKSGVIYALDLSGSANVNITSAEGKVCKLPTTLYLNELYRLLLDEKFPVYICQDNRLYVGYCDVAKRSVQRMRQELARRLNIFVEQQSNEDKILAYLNRLNSKVEFRSEWSSRLDYNGKGDVENYFYINLTGLDLAVQANYFDVLNQLVPQGCLEKDGNILSLRRVICADNVAESLENSMQVRQPTTPSQTLFRTVVSPLRRRHQTRAVPQPKEPKEHKEVARSEPKKPLVIKFSNSVCHYSDTALLNNLALGKRAYAMDVPWLPAGRAYASFDERLTASLPEYLSPENIIARLEVGMVRGSTRNQGTKAGTVGIQATTEPFYDIDGEFRSRSSFKMKFAGPGKNWRFFACRQEDVRIDGEHRVHFRFTGCGPGH